MVQVDSFNNLGKSQKQFQSWNYGKSDALDMSAELRDDVWDDLDDEVLVVASNLFSRELDEYETLHKYSTSEATSDISEDSCLLQGDTRIQNPVLSVFNSSSKVELSVQSGHINTFTSQENEHSNLSQELEKIQCSSISKIIPDSSKFTRKENFFIFTKEQEEEKEPRYLPDDETSDVKPLLGLLDDIF